MSIIKQYHKDTNTTYVYESQYYYDKDKKQSRSKRKLIGKIDEETGQTIPTGKRGRKKKTPQTDHIASVTEICVDDDVVQELMGKIEEKENEIILLKAQMESMEKRYRELVTEKEETIRNLQEREKKRDEIIMSVRTTLKKALGSHHEASSTPGGEPSCQRYHQKEE